MSETLIVDLKELETKVENGKGFNHKEATVLLEFVRKIIGNGGTVQPQLTIPKSIADELKGAIGATNFESTPYSIKLDEDGYLKMWASLRNKKLSEQAYKFCWNNTRVFDTYLNPLTRDLVKVVEND